MTDLVLKTPPTMSFADKETRTQFVQFVTELLSAGRRDFAPEQLNAGSTDLEWRVDAGNDWFVFFDRSDTSRVRIMQRYDVKPALMAIGAWLTYRWSMTVLTPELALPKA